MEDNSSSPPPSGCSTQSQAAAPVPSINTDDPDAYVEKLQRNWAKGPRLELKVTEDANTPYNPLVHPPIEPVCDIEIEQKRRKVIAMRKSIHAWLDYRARKTQKFKRCAKPENDEWARYLAQLSGLSKTKPKALQPHQRWSKDHFDDIVKKDFRKQWKKAGLPLKNLATFRDSITRKHFLKTSEETQELYKRLAKDDCKAAVEAWTEKLRAPSYSSPADRQVAIDRLADFTGPLLSGMSQIMGMHCSLFVGGPEPRAQGKIRIITMHEGTNNSLKPLDWRRFDKNTFRQCTKSFAHYLTTCYTEEQIQASRLPEDVTAEYTIDQDDSDNDLAAEGSKSKPMPKSRKKSSFDSDSESDSDSSEESMDSADDVAGIDDEDNDKHDQHSTADPDNNIDGNGDVEPLVPPSHSDTNPEPEASHKVADTEGVESPSTGDCQVNNANIETSNVDIEADNANMETSNDIEAQPSNNESDYVAGLPPDCPKWFLDSYVYLRAPSLPAQYASLLSVFVLLEQSSSFVSSKGPAHSLGKKHRPKAVGWWIARARSGIPPLPDLGKYSTDFWAWWIALQPTWRVITAPLDTPTPLPSREIAGSWHELDKPGQNGFLSVIGALNWWGKACQDQCVDDISWLAAVADVQWVMEQLIETHTSSTLATQNSNRTSTRKRSVACDISPPTKRVRTLRRR
ncbi:hypothetical protein P692DRAFT_20818540 [Suillus brevipes Sb2]|nr:hypothetical protein P692DRAFT_20818540 [Suillus brevipes Sb2]